MISIVSNLLDFSIIIQGLQVITTINPVYRIAQLSLVFVNGGLIFLTLDFSFLGLTYIIVYVGAIAILFLFVIMMVKIHQVGHENLKVVKPILPQFMDSKNLSLSKLKTNNNINENYEINDNDKENLILFKNKKTRILKSFFINNISSLINIILLFQIITSSFILINNIPEIHSYHLIDWSIIYQTFTDIQTLGNLLLLGYPLPLLLIGLTLWAVMIGVIQITME